ncbi:unnamed protein product [Cuscuta campestris]|uniref:Uncharacterized protein n=1 Tax=Cuscuta campestris TaxID=132261 RepID=A0A484MQQ1_9ASTE|nr:unnamed protein product [Cuscuta campestris]
MACFSKLIYDSYMLKNGSSKLKLPLAQFPQFNAILCSEHLIVIVLFSSHVDDCNCRPCARIAYLRTVTRANDVSISDPSSPRLEIKVIHNQRESIPSMARSPFSGSVFATQLSLLLWTGSASCLLGWNGSGFVLWAGPSPSLPRVLDPESIG